MSVFRQTHHACVFYNCFWRVRVLPLCSHLRLPLTRLLPCCRLVSAAEVPKTPNWFANVLLWLPTAATARLPVRFEFS